MREIASDGPVAALHDWWASFDHDADDRAYHYSVNMTELVRLGYPRWKAIVKFIVQFNRKYRMEKKRLR